MSIMSSVLETAMLQTTRKRSNTTGSYPGILDDYEFNSKIANQQQEQSQNTLKPLCETSPKSISIRDLRCGSSNYMLSESVEEEVPRVHYIL
ncbi:unnamed protein product, partial [Anisakis simplex]|uniref:Uncharacterized protein n=1 Tax=Anisakis simplex TaxID=6269 RepID=A0A0M3JQL2_ANISI